MDILAQMTEKIIKQQESIIGPLAVEQAKKVPGLTVDWSKHQVTITGNKKAVLEHLVEQYKYLFGQTSVEVCKDAVKDMIAKVPKDQLPSILA